MAAPFKRSKKIDIALKLQKALALMPNNDELAILADVTRKTLYNRIKQQEKKA